VLGDIEHELLRPRRTELELRIRSAPTRRAARRACSATLPARARQASERAARGRRSGLRAATTAAARAVRSRAATERRGADHVGIRAARALELARDGQAVRVLDTERAAGCGREGARGVEPRMSRWYDDEERWLESPEGQAWLRRYEAARVELVASMKLAAGL